MAAHREDIAVVTVAPELPGGIDLVRALAAAGHRVSLGHSGADYDTAMEAVEAGARQATHLFNRMPPVSHRSPGLAGAMLESPRVAVELIADGVHVHPAICRMAIAAKGTGRVMAISDGTAAAGLPVGATAWLGGRRIHARSHAAELDDGTLAGSTATMDRIFATLVTRCGASPVDAAAMCALTPARQLGLVGHGVIAEGAVADLVVLGPAFDVRYTLVAGRVGVHETVMGMGSGSGAGRVSSHKDTRPQCPLFSAAAWSRTPSDRARRSPGTHRGARGTCCTGRSGRRPPGSCTRA